MNSLPFSHFSFDVSISYFSIDDGLSEKNHFDALHLPTQKAVHIHKYSRSDPGGQQGLMGVAESGVGDEEMRTGSDGFGEAGGAFPLEDVAESLGRRRQLIGVVLGEVLLFRHDGCRTRRRRWMTRDGRHRRSDLG